MKKKIINRYDWIIYRLAYRSMNRFFRNNPAFGYISKLSHDKWYEEHPLPEDLRESTELFFDSLQDIKHLKEAK